MVSLQASQKEGDFLVCMLRVSDQRVFPHVFFTSPGSPGLNKSRLSLPATRRQIHREVAGFEWEGCLPSIKGPGAGRRDIFKGNLRVSMFSSRHRAY